MKNFFTSLAVLFLSFLAPAVSAGEKGQWTLGLNYPGFSVRYHLSDLSSAEGRAQFSDNITIVSARWNRHLRRRGGLSYLYGAEAGIVSFKGTDSRGDGGVLGVFAGVEKFLTENVSVQTDAGPYLAGLSDNQTGLSQSGLVFSLNLGINWRLRSGNSK